MPAGYTTLGHVIDQAERVAVAHAAIDQLHRDAAARGAEQTTAPEPDPPADDTPGRTP